LEQFSIFEYCYCDASNFKVWGHILLKGVTNANDLKRLQSSFESGEFFIAEQLGLPQLYRVLWGFSDGPTVDDHVWHTFHQLRPAEACEVDQAVFDTLENFVKRVELVSRWDEETSIHSHCLF
jgi:hypothetical protein